MDQKLTTDPQNISPGATPPVGGRDVEFRFRAHVHEYICPANPGRDKLGSRSVFAGGGITNCPDWQEVFAQLVNERMVELLRTETSLPGEIVLSVLNPRRQNFPINDPSASQFQITWEHSYLQQTKAISLWFPKDSEGPISLFETGKWMMSAKPFFLGIEPGYPRTEELLAHIYAVRPHLQAAESLEQHATNVARWALGIGRIDCPVVAQQVRERSLYFAGGIAQCPDWQQELSGHLRGEDIHLENPRIRSFKRGSDAEYRSLVLKNRVTMNGCEAVAMWFPKEHLTPVALLELGSLVASSKPLFIGIEPGYKRQLDVEIQTRLERPEIDIVYSLPDVAEQVKQYFAMRLRVNKA